MALRAVPEHPKFAGLMARLGRSRFEVLGALEMMWHFCGKFTPAGNIGKYTDQQIESWIGWNGAPGELIEALVVERWIDKDLNHRLLVHDWAIHSDRAAKASAKRNGGFIDATCVTHARTDGNDVAHVHSEVVTASALPEPVPEPEPEPGSVPRTTPPTSRKLSPNSEDPSLIAQVVLAQCGLGGRWNLIAITDAVKTGLVAGNSPEALVAQMVSMWRECEAAFPKFKREVRPENFFADGMWRDKAKWPWKEGQKPESASSKRPATIEEVRAEADRKAKASK